jgi:hypothetical protein
LNVTAHLQSNTKWLDEAYKKGRTVWRTIRLEDRGRLSHVTNGPWRQERETVHKGPWSHDESLW